MSKQNLEMIELGCLLVMCVYHVILFSQIRRNYYLYLGLLCFIVLVRASLVEDGSQLFFQVFNVDSLTGLKIEYLTAYSSMLLLPMFVYDLFTFRSFLKYLRFFQVVGGLLMVFVLMNYPGAEPRSIMLLQRIVLVVLSAVSYSSFLFLGSAHTF